MQGGSTGASIGLILLLFIASQVPAQNSNRITGTLVVAVPVREGLVACADKRFFNADAGTFTDNNVKIRKVNGNALFVATNTVGFTTSGREKWFLMHLRSPSVTSQSMVSAIDRRSGKGS